METIAAISTAMGEGGIGIVRMSGKESFTILKKIFMDAKMKEIDIKNIKGYTIKYGYIIHNDTKEVIDEVLVSFFRGPKSYTREDMCEINTHGGIVVVKKILEECLNNGAELAQPGEFTKRAFLNGRIDLSQAESVIDIIQAKSEKEVEASVKQLEGNLSKKIKEIQKQILDQMADIEASIDYPEYDIEEVTNEKALQTLFNIKEQLNQLENSFKNGKILKEGINTAIIGKPNVGKSSLLNYILEEDRAIVSDIEGTTRDTIEEMITIKGIPLKIIDTAGIRKTTDKIEEMGVNKALKIMEDADLILAIFDNTRKLDEEDKQILKKLKDKKAIILINKIDIQKDNLQNSKEVIETNKKIIHISAQKGIGIDELYDEIEKMFQLNEIDSNKEIIITNMRHKNQIALAKKSIGEAIEAVTSKYPIDMIAIPMRQCLEELGKITGENVSEDIINEIFSKFCLGK